MDPELYVFPRLQNPVLKILASTAIFALLVAAARLLPFAHLWTATSADWATVATTTIGYIVFLYASYRAWLATRQKNHAEDPKRAVALRLLEDGSYASVRHPMYGMFILANAGLGLALNTTYGLGFSLLSILLFQLNGAIEERAGLIAQFGERYLAYMGRVPARFFTLPQALLLAAVIGLNVVGYMLR